MAMAQAGLFNEIAALRAALRWVVLLTGRQNPYHEPAGSSKGGQFAKVPGGASIVVGSTKLGEAAASKKVMTALAGIPETVQNGLKVTVTDQKGEGFTASDGTNFEQAGSYSADGNVTLNNFANLKAAKCQEILRHEVGHHAYATWFSKAAGEYPALKKSRPEMFDAKGKVKAQYTKEYAKVAPYDTAYTAFSKAYERGDGITAYSKAYRGNPSETVAEYARIRWARGKTTANDYARSADQDMARALSAAFDLLEGGQ
jgi:hypothetical protein